MTNKKSVQFIADRIKGFSRFLDPIAPFPRVICIVVLILTIGAGTVVVRHLRAKPAATISVGTDTLCVQGEKGCSTPNSSVTISPTTASPTSAPPSSTPNTPTQNSAKTAPSNSNEQAYEDEMNQIKWENTMCIAPLDKINASASSAINSNQITAQSGRNAISYAPGTPQFRSVYNSIAFTYNFNIDLVYNYTYLSGIDSLNSSAHCNLPVAWQKPAYWDMIDANGNYVPYTEGSHLSDY